MPSRPPQKKPAGSSKAPAKDKTFVGRGIVPAFVGGPKQPGGQSFPFIGRGAVSSTPIPVQSLKGGRLPLTKAQAYAVAAGLEGTAAAFPQFAGVLKSLSLNAQGLARSLPGGARGGRALSAEREDRYLQDAPTSDILLARIKEREQARKKKGGRPMFEPEQDWEELGSLSDLAAEAGVEPDLTDYGGGYGDGGYGGGGGGRGGAYQLEPWQYGLLTWRF